MAGNKRIDLLVQALAHVKRDVPEATLLLVGDDRGSPAYREVVEGARRLAKELGVDRDVVWTGAQFPQDPYLRLADVYVTASLHEGFGVPLVEAMASGVPVVASRAGAMPWVLGDAGLLADPGDVASLANQVVRILRDDELRGTLVQRGLERAGEFSLERYTARLAELVDRAVVYTLPPVAVEAGTAPAGARKRKATDSGREVLVMDVLAGEIEAQSDVAMRDYVVRSRVPVVGPLVAWLRRNATSHLREPYLDLIVERQVGVNRRVADWIRRSSAAQEAALDRQAELEARVRGLEAQVEDLARRLEEQAGSPQQREGWHGGIASDAGHG
jgi:hypothetical protein